MYENIRTSGKSVMFKINKLARNEHAHFHPSGSCSPSKADIAITKRIKESYELLGINFLDHIIIGHDQNYSFSNESAILNENSTNKNINESFLKSIENKYIRGNETQIEL